jgi:hypothetical protein
MKEIVLHRSEVEKYKLGFIMVRNFQSVEKLTWLPVAFLLGAGSTNLLWYESSLIDRHL